MYIHYLTERGVRNIDSIQLCYKQSTVVGVK